MSLTTIGYSPPPPHHEGPHWVSIGLAVMMGLIGVAILLAVVLPGGLTHSGGPAFPGWWAFGWLWGIFWLLVFFWIISWFIRSAVWCGTGSCYGHRRRWRYYGWDSAGQILRERYARGEITREQFDQMTRDLESRAH